MCQNVPLERRPGNCAPHSPRCSRRDKHDGSVLSAFRRQSDVEIETERHRFVLPSFDAYFEPFEHGAGSPAQAYVSLPEETRRVVREEVRRDLGDKGGPIEIEVEYRFASGRR